MSDYTGCTDPRSEGAHQMGTAQHPAETIRPADMYGNPIFPLGETGYGVSTTFYRKGGGMLLRPMFTVFHVSDGFRQSLFSVTVDDVPQVSNVFRDRIDELWATEPHMAEGGE